LLGKSASVDFILIILRMKERDNIYCLLNIEKKLKEMYVGVGGEIK